MNDELEKAIFEKLNELYNRLPKLPDGRINYKKSDVALVVTVFVKRGDKILLLKRSDKVGTYKGKWNAVAGYIDEFKSIKEKILEELEEEIGISENDISSIKIGQPYEFVDEKINKKWIVVPALVELADDVSIKLNWEHVEYRWVKREEIKSYDVVPNLEESLNRVWNAE